jgi:hypothetical protein
MRPLLVSYENLIIGWQIINNSDVTETPTLQEEAQYESQNKAQYVSTELIIQTNNDEELFRLIDEPIDESPLASEEQKLNEEISDGLPEGVPDGLIDLNNDIAPPPEQPELQAPRRPPAPPTHLPPAPPTPINLNTEVKNSPNFPAPPKEIPALTNPKNHEFTTTMNTVTSIDSALIAKIKETLNHSYKFYNKIMLLVINSNETITPIHWDKNFKPKDTARPISLYQPSPFRIAFKTAKPFHGPVSMNHILEMFVHDWLSGNPIHLLTIVPLVENNMPFALLLGIADNDIDLRDSLTHIQKIAETTTKQIANTATPKAS